jgi:hypothetical protein
MAVIREADLDSTSIWLLAGSREAIEVILKRVANEYRANKTGFSLSHVEFADGRPAFTLYSTGTHARQLGLLAVEELVNGRSQMRIPPPPFNPSLESPENRTLFVSYLNEALEELTRLGFVISTGQPFLPGDMQGEDGEQFTPEEQAQIVDRLDALESYLLTQFELSRQQIEFVRRELAGLREEVGKSNRWTWRHLARSVVLGIASALGGQAVRLLITEQAWEVLRPFLGPHLPLLGAG